MPEYFVWKPLKIDANLTQKNSATDSYQHRNLFELDILEHRILVVVLKEKKNHISTNNYHN